MQNNEKYKQQIYNQKTCNLEKEKKDIEKKNDKKNDNKNENIEKNENQIFKNLNLECFPYLRLLELWRKKCLCSLVEKLRADKVLLFICVCYVCFFNSATRKIYKKSSKNKNLTITDYLDCNDYRKYAYFFH